MTARERRTAKIDPSLIGEILAEIVDDAARFRRGDAGEPLRIGLMAVGSEHESNGDAGQAELLRGATLAARRDRSVEIVMIGPKTAAAAEMTNDGSAWIETADEETAIAGTLNEAIATGAIAGAVALHYPFPLGVATVGRVITPRHGKEMLVAATTGTTATDRVEAMVRNAVAGIAAAKALGIGRPTVGILNVDGAQSAQRILQKMSEAGYDIAFGASTRADGGAILRGNDLLAGAVDVCVTDTLTGNILMKLFSSWNNGGVSETLGYGYGPSIGADWDRVISIVSRASGAPVIADALLYTAEALRGDLPARAADEFRRAGQAGLSSLAASPVKSTQQAAAPAPPAEPVDEEILGVDVLTIEEATKALWDRGIYAEATMGCTGPVIKVPARALSTAMEALAAAGYL